MAIIYRVGDGGSPCIPESLSEEGRDFLSQCFINDPKERWSAEMLEDHHFVMVKYSSHQSIDISSKFIHLSTYYFLRLFIYTISWHNKYLLLISVLLSIYVPLLVIFHTYVDIQLTPVTSYPRLFGLLLSRTNSWSLWFVDTDTFVLILSASRSFLFCPGGVQVLPLDVTTPNDS